MEIPIHVLNDLEEEALDKIIDYLPREDVAKLAVIHNNALALYVLRNDFNSNRGKCFTITD